jgi:hypothetical protein
VDDAERQHLQLRLEESERARRRWKVVAVVGTPVLAALFGLALANAVTTSLTLKEVVQRERQTREDAQRATDEARQQAEQAEVAAVRALKQEEVARQALEAALKGTAHINLPLRLLSLGLFWSGMAGLAVEHRPPVARDDLMAGTPHAASRLTELFPGPSSTS